MGNNQTSSFPIPRNAIANRLQYSLRYWTIFQKFKIFFHSRFFLGFFVAASILVRMVAGASGWRGFQINNASLRCAKTATRKKRLRSK